MKEDIVYRAVGEALRAFRVAENEFNRPDEDVVTLCACRHTRECVDRFLVAYLRKTSPETPETLQTAELLQSCAGREAGFRAIDLSCFTCKSDPHNPELCDARYCLSVDKVGACFSTARAVKALVMDKLNYSEADFK